MATIMNLPQGTYRGFGEALGGGMGQGASQVIGMWMQGQMQMKMQEATRVREQANKIVTSMRKNPANKNAMKEYDEWINPAETLPSQRKGPREGSTEWAREVVKRYGHIASPTEELEREMTDLKRRAVQMLKLTGEDGEYPDMGLGPGRVPGLDLPSFGGPGPGLGGGQGLGLGLKGGPGPGGGPMGTPQQRGISPGVVLGLEKPTDPFKMLELQLDAMGVLDAQTRTQIQSLRARTATMAEERAGKEFPVEEAGREATRATARDRLKADRVNKIYERLGRTLDDIETARTMGEEQKLIRGVRARVNSVRQLKNVSPKEAQEAAVHLADHILSSTRDIMMTPGLKNRPEFQGLSRDLKSELKMLYSAVGLPVRQAVESRMKELQQFAKTEEEVAQYEELVIWLREVW